MKQYLDLLSDVISNGEDRSDRTGTGTRSVFGRQIRFDLREGFPLLTTKKVHFKSVLGELLWFLDGDTNTRFLYDNGITIWDEWADETGELGPIYGFQWRGWYKANHGYIDQIEKLIIGIKRNPTSRRHIVTSWNVSDLPSETISPQENVKLGLMALAPCHMMFQFYVSGENQEYLSCHMYQRSADLFLGVPFNIASYALLTHIISKITCKIPKELIISFGDLHLYKNHLTRDIVYEQLSRDPGSLPRLNIRYVAHDPAEYTFNDFELIGYHPQPAIKAPISV